MASEQNRVCLKSGLCFIYAIEVENDSSTADVLKPLTLGSLAVLVRTDRTIQDMQPWLKYNVSRTSHDVHEQRFVIID